MANGIQPQWMEISHTSVYQAVVDLCKITGAHDFAISLDDYIQNEFKGDHHRVMVDDGFATIHADMYCPPGTLWPLPQLPRNPARELGEIEACAKAILSWVEKARG